MSSPFADNFGGRRALLTSLGHQSLGALGRYRNYVTNDLSDVRRLVFVCKGNICRSPFAEYYARSIGIESDSCGLDASTGTPANPLAQSTASTLGVSLKTHTATHISEFETRDGDLIIGFEPWHAEALARIVPDGGRIVGLAGMWLVPRMPHIQDPYATTPGYFRTCFERIVRAVDSLRAAMPGAGTSV